MRGRGRSVICIDPGIRSRYAFRSNRIACLCKMGETRDLVCNWT